MKEKISFFFWRNNSSAEFNLKKNEGLYRVDYYIYNVMNQSSVYIWRLLRYTPTTVVVQIKYNNNNSVDSPTTFTTKFLNTFSFVIKNTWRASIFLNYKHGNKKVYHNKKKIKIRRWLKSVSTAHSTRWWNTKTKRTDRHSAHATI